MQETMPGRRMGKKTTYGLDKQHQHVDQTYCGGINQNDKRQRSVEKVRPWCGQPSDRGSNFEDG